MWEGHHQSTDEQETEGAKYYGLYGFHWSVKLLDKTFNLTTQGMGAA